MEGITNTIVNVALIGVGILALIFGISRKGPMFHNPKIKEEYKEVFNRRFSLFLIGAGLLMFFAVVLDFVRVSDLIRLVSYLLIIFWSAYFALSTKKYMK